MRCQWYDDVVHLHKVSMLEETVYEHVLIASEYSRVEVVLALNRL